MQFLCCLLFAMIIFSALPLPRAEAVDSDGRLTPEEFPILPWSSSPGDLELLKGIRDCGFNLAGFVSPKNVDIAYQAGLKSIVRDVRIIDGLQNPEIDDAQANEQAKEIVSGLLENPGVFGYYIWDEPSAPFFPALKRWESALKKADPRALCYINLLPNYASAGQLGTDSYEDYLETYIQTVTPEYFSYDHYAIMDDGTLRDGYFQNLEAARKASLKHNIPFWNIILSNCHFRYGEPTYDSIRFQVFTTLAYGARGISYFTYFLSPTGNYRLSPVNQFRDRTPTWDMVRNANLQIHKLGPTYLKLKSVNVFHHPEVPHDCVGIDTSKHIAEVSGGNFLVGEFEDADGKPYAMVVNKDLHYSTAFSVKFKEEGQIMITNSYTGRLHPWVGENNWLAPGQGMLLSVKE